MVGAALSFWNTEGAVFIFAEIESVAAVWFSVSLWARFNGRMTIRPIGSMAHLTICSAVRFFAPVMLPLTEASLHVAESIGTALFGRRTWRPALALAEAIESIEAGAIGITGWNFDIAIRDAVVDL